MSRRDAPASPPPSEGAPSGHTWLEDRCERCGLQREEAWFLDEDGVAILALVWTDEGGQMTVRPFPPMLGLRPPRAPELTVSDVLPHVPVGREPRCVDPVGGAPDSDSQERS